jgi:hypothetical protein
MNRLSRNLKIIRLMLIEERRLNAAMIGQAQFLLFPVMILFMSFVIGMASKQMLKSIPMAQVYLILHSIILVYGLAVGGFALFGERMAQRRIGEVTMLLETPRIHPVTFRTVFLAFYVKDTIYYMLYSIVPLIGGLALTIPFTGFRVASVLFLLLTITLSFLTGISFSFFLSSMYVRWKALFAAVVTAILALLAGSRFTHQYSLAQLVPSIMVQRTGDPIYILISVVLIIAFSFVAVNTLKITFGRVSERYADEMLSTARKFAFTKGYSTLMAKDWIDLIRSRTLMPVVGAYIGPLAFLAVLFWFLGTVLTFPLHFNLIFFGAMIGFFGVSVYGWLNLLDTPSFLDVLPISVASMIKTKLRLFTMLAGVTSTVFLVGLSILQTELDMLGIGLIVAYSTTFYTVTSTAYLTGLRTNSYLFDPRVLAKFAGVVIPPLIALTILSFRFTSDRLISMVVILAISAALAAATVLLYRGIDRRWSRESFAF